MLWDLINSNEGAELLRISQKERLLLDSYNNQSLFGVSLCTPPLLSSLFKKQSSSYPFSLAKKRLHMDIIWKKNLLIWYPLFQQAESWWLHYNALLMVNSTLICKRLYDKYMLFAHFILCKKKVRNLVCISSKVRIFWRWTHTFSVDKLTKNHPVVKWTPKYVFSQVQLYK